MIKQVIGWIVAFLGMIGAAYIGGYRLLLVPMLEILDSFANKTFNWSLLFTCGIKILFSIPIAYLLVIISFAIASYCWRWWK